MVPLAPFGERITIQNKCYEIKNLYKWIIDDNNDVLPGTITIITPEEKQILMDAYEALVPNVLTRDILIEIFPNLQNESYVYLSQKVPLADRGYNIIAPNTFTRFGISAFNNNLSNLINLNLTDNKIRNIQPPEVPSAGTFNNLPMLEGLRLSGNNIRELYPDMFGNNLQRLEGLWLDYNHIIELQPVHNVSSVGIFGDNLPRLKYLFLSYNKIKNLQPPEVPSAGIFNGLPLLEYLFLNNNQISATGVLGEL